MLNKDEPQQWEINNAYDKLLAGINGLKDIENLVYFVDCGDHDPVTVTYGDDFGLYNSVTDQMYGVDDKAGYSWGVLMIDPREKETPGQGSTVVEGDKAVYTNYQKALSNGDSNFADGQDKTATFALCSWPGYRGNRSPVRRVQI